MRTLKRALNVVLIATGAVCLLLGCLVIWAAVVSSIIVLWP